MCVYGTHWPAGVLILSKERLAGVCLWYIFYQVVSRCVDIVQRDLSVCAYGTKWSVGVLILSKETCRCVPMVPNGQPVC